MKTVAYITSTGDEKYDDILTKIAEQFDRLTPHQVLNFLIGTLAETCRLNDISKQEMMEKVSSISDMIYAKSQTGTN